VGTVLIAALAVASAFSPVLAAAWRGDRAALLAGEGWRLWTAHLAHFSASHALWSGLAWLGAAAWLERADRAAWLALIGLGAPLVTLSALLGDAAMIRYGGLSGLACAPVAWWGGALWRDERAPRRRRAGGAALLGLLAAKCLGDFGSAEGVALLARFSPGLGEVRVAAWAHVAGAGLGVAGAWGWPGARDLYASWRRKCAMASPR
jgi:hypothetical protein